MKYSGPKHLFLYATNQKILAKKGMIFQREGAETQSRKGMATVLAPLRLCVIAFCLFVAAWWPRYVLCGEILVICGYFSRMTRATAASSEWDRLRWTVRTPDSLLIASARPPSANQGAPCSFLLISASSQVTPCAHPVPRALKSASFAANRAAKYGAGSRCARQYSCSPAV